MPGNVSDINIDKPRWDQSTFSGRFKHFSAITDVRKLFASEQELEQAKSLVLKHRAKLTPPGTSEDELWKAKHLYDSTFHPDSGQKMNLFGRMSFQAPGGMAITALMLHFYKTPLQAATTQWANQSFNGLVNYTNRNAESSTTTGQMFSAYCMATSAALAVALGLNIFSRRAPQIVARWVPFVAVATANSVNIPLSRQAEWKEGVTVRSVNGEELGSSKKCAVKGISQVLLSRIAMAAPGMICIPIAMQQLEKKSAWFRRNTWSHLPFQTVALGCFLICMVPIACSFYPQQASMRVSDLEPELAKSIKSRKDGDRIEHVYFNKGL